ncbi:hypothetical protein L1049_002420 [Liquidambar formosana]|uniref:Uncharacterized protein n=1 Tax=Liquidambar formosana TaxID=63359 RepID=A0AAP0NH24_LIQFO
MNDIVLRSNKRKGSGERYVDLHSGGRRRPAFTFVVDDGEELLVPSATHNEEEEEVKLNDCVLGGDLRKTNKSILIRWITISLHVKPQFTVWQDPLCHGMAEDPNPPY